MLGLWMMVQLTLMLMISAWALNTGILWSSERWLFGTNGLFSGIVGAAAQMLDTEHEVLSSNAAKVLATGIVLFWNFFVNRLWTFRDVDAAKPSPAVTESPVAPAD